MGRSQLYLLVGTPTTDGVGFGYATDEDFVIVGDAWRNRSGKPTVRFLKIIILQAIRPFFKPEHGR